MKMSIRNTVFILVVLAAWAAVILLLRDSVWTQFDYPGGRARREITVRTVGAPAEDEAEELRLYDVYREGDGPAPAWYRPSEPMAAEYNARETHGQSDSVDYNAQDADYLLDVPLDAEFQRYLHDLCAEYGVPYTLAVAVIEAESSYMPNVISTSHDFGLMQINVVCHEWLRGELGIVDFLDPYQNALAGVYILSGYYARYGYDSGTLVAYNQGQYSAELLFAQGVYTSAYSDRVIGIRDRLEREGA